MSRSERRRRDNKGAVGPERDRDGANAVAVRMDSPRGRLLTLVINNDIIHTITVTKNTRSDII